MDTFEIYNRAQALGFIGCHPSALSSFPEEHKALAETAYAYGVNRRRRAKMGFDAETALPIRTHLWSFLHSFLRSGK